MTRNKILVYYIISYKDIICMYYVLYFKILDVCWKYVRFKILEVWRIPTGIRCSCQYLGEISLCLNVHFVSVYVQTKEQLKIMSGLKIENINRILFLKFKVKEN